MMSYLSSLKPFAHGLCSQLGSKILCCRNNSYKSKLFTLGHAKLENDIDITRVLKILRKVEVLESICLPKHQRYFLPYMNQNVLREDEEPPHNRTIK